MVQWFWDAGEQEDDLPKAYRKLRKIAEKKCVVDTVRAGDRLVWDDDLSVEVLAPPERGVESKKKDRDNDNSIVLRIQHGEVVILLPGDIERRGVESLLRSAPERLKSQVLIAPHHGFCDSRAFAEAVAAEHVIVSCDADYPDKKISDPGAHATELFGSLGARVHVTSQHGRIEVFSNGTSCQVIRER